MDFCDQHSLRRLRNLSERQTCRCILPLGSFHALEGLICNQQEQLSIETLTEPCEADAVVCRIRVNGRLQMPCQRCIEVMTVTVSSSVTWILTESGQLPSGMDLGCAESLVFAEYKGILDLIGQELVLAVPMVAKHEHDDCPGAHLVDIVPMEQIIEVRQGRNPAFDVLQSLKS